jgi:hypothetical protein
MRSVQSQRAKDKPVATKTQVKQQAVKPAAKAKAQTVIDAPRKPSARASINSAYKARQSKGIVRPAPVVDILPDGRKVKVQSKRGNAPGSQDVIIHKDSWMRHGIQSFTPLTSVTVPALLGAIAATGNLTLACEQLNMSRLSVYAFKAESPEFAKALNEAQQLGVEAWKDAAAKRAFQGWERPIYQQGLQVGADRHFSDTLALAFLKAADPEHFQDRSRMELGPAGADGGGLFSGKTEEDINEALTNKMKALAIVVESSKKTGTDV